MSFPAQLATFLRVVSSTTSINVGLTLQTFHLALINEKTTRQSLMNHNPHLPTF